MATTINAAELDTDLITANFKEKLTSQEQFKDFNFEGSNMAVVLDILAYNTHYNNLYTNFSLNEVFLDSAIKRDSVVSLAKGLGYTPRSAISARANITVTVTNTGSGAPDILILPANTSFLTSGTNTKYSYVTDRPYSASFVNGAYIFSSVDIIEGETLVNTYTGATGIRYIVQNIGCDLSTLKVKVQENSTSSSFDYYQSAENIINVSNDSLVFYTKEIENGLYEVYFGEDVIGKQPITGNIITLQYTVSTGSASNGAKTFTYNGDTLADGIVSVTTNSQSTSGKDPESIESIRINAPNFFSSQDRAVQPDDYKTLIYKNIPNIDSISVWGGEDNIPKQYGKVFISVKPTGRNRISLVEQNSILSLLKGKKVTCIIPEFVDPESLDIIINSSVYYDPSLTNKTPNDLALIVIETMSDYNTKVLGKFETIYKHSNLSSKIDTSEKSILSNSSTVSLIKTIYPTIASKFTLNINIFNPVDSLKSQEFYIDSISSPVYFKNVGSVISLFYLNSTSVETKISDIGKVDLTTGKITGIVNISRLNSNDGSLEINIIPDSNDVISKLNQVAKIDLVKSNVNVIINSTNNYIFTPNKL